MSGRHATGARRARTAAAACLLAAAAALAAPAAARAVPAASGPRATVVLHAAPPAAGVPRLPTLVELVRASEWVLGVLFVDEGLLPARLPDRPAPEHHYFGQILSIQHSPPDSAVRGLSWFVDDPPAGAAPGPTSARDSIRWNEGDRRILFLLPDVRDARRVATAYGRHGIFDFTDTTVTGVVAAADSTRRPVELKLGIIAFTDTIIRIDRALRAEADSLRKAEASKAAADAAKKARPAAPAKPRARSKKTR